MRRLSRRRVVVVVVVVAVSVVVVLTCLVAVAFSVVIVVVVVVMYGNCFSLAHAREGIISLSRLNVAVSRSETDKKKTRSSHRVCALHVELPSVSLGRPKIY